MMSRALVLVQGWIGDGFAAWLAGRRHPLARELGAFLAANERLREENGLLRARLGRIRARERPRYRPEDRLAILGHRKRWRLSLEETARRFVVAVTTLENWRKAVEAGVTRLVTTREPMNKLADLVREVAHAIRRERPRWGSRRVAAVLAKLGLAGSRRSVQRILRRPPPGRPILARACRISRARPVQPRRPGHLWYADFTEVRAFMGIATVTIGAVIDGFSRRVLALEAWPGRACSRTAGDAILLVRRAIHGVGAPRWVVTDQGAQFTARRFGAYLARRKIRRRFGAVGRPQAVARVDRFFRSLKGEWADPFFALKPLKTIRRGLSLYAAWFNDHRVHEGLGGGGTPSAVFAGRPPRRPRRLESGRRYVLSISYVDDRRKLAKFVLRAA